VPGLMELVFPAVLGSLCYIICKRSQRRPLVCLIVSSFATGLGSNLLIAVFVTRFQPASAMPEGDLWSTAFVILSTPFTMLFVASLIILERTHSSAIGAMADSERRMLHSQKMAAVGQLAQKVAHSFANALTGVIGNAELAKGSPECTPKLRELMDEIIESGSHVSTLTGELLAFSSSGASKMMRIDPSKCLVGVDEMLRKAIGSNVEVSLDLDSGIGKVQVDPDRIEQAIVHLALNAAEAMDGAGRLSISLKKAELSSSDKKRLQAGVFDKNHHMGDFAIISVTDMGHGIKNEDLLRIFEPFFTTKKSRRNAGLGLATVYNIVQQNNGFIDVMTELGKGSTFLIYVPLVTA
jgi:two-component system cell cycle sensor histidine kinase/response regulator CckA